MDDDGEQPRVTPLEDAPGESVDGWQNPRNNPHVAQVFMNPASGYESRTDIPFARILSENYPTRPYRRRTGEHKSVIHWGQRKLLLSEIEFLTMYAKKGRTVVYAGAAPGTHIRYLADLFPEVDFVLVDPAPFSITNTRQIEIRRELFTDDIAREYAGRSTLFISDVRSADWKEMVAEESDRQVCEDMVDQRRWHELMQPRKSMLKFRLSYLPGMTEYLTGKIYLPIWGPITTTEARLVPTEGVVVYDNAHYEQQMFYFNTVGRVALYAHSVSGMGIDHCYDCRAEIEVLREYLVSRGRLRQSDSDDDVFAAIAHMSSEVSLACAANRTLACPNSDPDVRRKGMRERQWIGGVPAYVHAKQGGGSSRDGRNGGSMSAADAADAARHNRRRSHNSEGSLRSGGDDSGDGRDRRRHRDRAHRDRSDKSKDRKHGDDSAGGRLDGRGGRGTHTGVRRYSEGDPGDPADAAPGGVRGSHPGERRHVKPAVGADGRPQQSPDAVVGSHMRSADDLRLD